MSELNRSLKQNAAHLFPQASRTRCKMWLLLDAYADGRQEREAREQVKRARAIERLTKDVGGNRSASTIVIDAIIRDLIMG